MPTMTPVARLFMAGHYDRGYSLLESDARAYRRCIISTILEIGLGVYIGSLYFLSHAQQL